MVEGIRIQEINLKDISLLKDFIGNLGNSKESFRYYETRHLNVISNHLLTTLAFVDSTPVGYGHLDKEGDKIWFGIAVAEKYKGKGIGNKVMQYIIEYSDDAKIMELYLSVDSTNEFALRMYKKFNFFKVKALSSKTVLMKRKKSYGI